jgi:hypothetical protein
MVATPYLGGHHLIVGEVKKIRMVVTPYLNGLNTLTEWSQYHIGFSIKEWS